jgi:hypothetical protein
MNEHDEFIKNMAQAHKKNVEDFGLPDKLILSEDVKLWRVTCKLTHVARDEQASWPEIVPVYSGSRQIGAASIYPKGDALYAKATLTYDLPERLDHDNGAQLTLFPDFVVPKLLVKGLSFRFDRLFLESEEHDQEYAISTWDEDEV